MPSLAELTETYVKAPARVMTATLWTEADPNQQKLTVQLARNSFYFTLSSILIRFFGDYLAI